MLEVDVVGQRCTDPVEFTPEVALVLHQNLVAAEILSSRHLLL